MYSRDSFVDPLALFDGCASATVPSSDGWVEVSVVSVVVVSCKLLTIVVGISASSVN